MMEEERKDIFLSCFKCGRIVRSSDTECPRCGLQFGPGTLFECPFCCGLVWRNATTCSTCGIDLVEFSKNVERSSASFDMDEFVDSLIRTEIESLKESVRRFACPGCGLMIRGDEDKCPRCDLPLGEAEVDCPVCGEKTSLSASSCPACGAQFGGLSEASEEGRNAQADTRSEGEAESPLRGKGKASRKSRTARKKAVRKGKKRA